MTDYEYKVVPFYEGCTGTLDEGDLERVLNQEATEGWEFARSIQEKRRVWLFFTRQERFLIFQRETSGGQTGGSTGATSFDRS